jgi:hypothetical protein
VVDCRTGAIEKGERIYFDNEAVKVRFFQFPVRILQCWAQLFLTMATELKITFSELRQTTNRIIELVSRVTGYEKEKIDLRTSINNTIGVDGDDWDDILIALHKQEDLTLEGLNFYDYFQDEGQIAFGSLNVLTLPIRFFFFLISFAWLREVLKAISTLALSQKVI